MSWDIINNCKTYNELANAHIMAGASGISGCDAPDTEIIMTFPKTLSDNRRYITEAEKDVIVASFYGKLREELFDNTWYGATIHFEEESE